MNNKTDKCEEGTIVGGLMGSSSSNKGWGGRGDRVGSMRRTKGTLQLHPRGDHLYFPGGEEEVEAFLQLYPANKELDRDILKNIMLRAIVPNKKLKLRNIQFSNTIKVSMLSCVYFLGWSMSGLCFSSMDNTC